MTFSRPVCALHKLCSSIKQTQNHHKFALLRGGDIGQYMGTYKGKGKVVPVLLTEHHAMKAYWGVEV
jgi:hypothetical protein